MQQELTGINIHPDPFLDLTKPSERWVKMTHEARCECLYRTISLRTDGVQFLHLNKVNHVVVRIQDHERRQWPTILRELETLLKREVEPSLQVYLEPRQDDSLLRLSLRTKEKK